MKIKTICPHCAITLAVEDKMVGRDVRCPKCRETFEITDSRDSEKQTIKVDGSVDKEMLDVIDKAVLDDGTTIEVVNFPNLKGSADLRVAENLFYAEQSGMNMKMVKVTQKDTHVRVEPGALYFMKGSLEMKASTGGGLLKGLSRKMLSKESFFVNEIHGTGEIYLEPTFGHFILYRIKPEDNAVIVDKGLFYAGTADLAVSAVSQKNISSAIFGGEGIFQTLIKGSGIAVLYSPVPISELLKIELNDETLSVDGNFALMRTEGISYSVKKSSKTWMSTAVSGEGLLQTFSGTGTVWIAPTQGIYDRLAATGGMAQMALAQGSMGTKAKTKTKKNK